jgi:hypothetical protein
LQPIEDAPGSYVHARVHTAAGNQGNTPLGQKIEAEKNGDTVLIRGSPVGRGDYDLQNAQPCSSQWVQADQ